MSDDKDRRADSSLVDETLLEHASCMELVSELERCLDRRPLDPERWLADVSERLTRLGVAMREHFVAEESGPLFRNLPLQHPRLADSLARLEAEHPVMLDRLDAVLERAAALRNPQDFELRELNARVQLLVARIRRHEAAENELVLEAHWDQIGEGD
jgi:uncharacterized protein YqcC (DUF446 family)